MIARRKKRQRENKMIIWSKKMAHIKWFICRTVCSIFSMCLMLYLSFGVCAEIWHRSELRLMYKTISHITYCGLFVGGVITFSALVHTFFLCSRIWQNFANLIWDKKLKKVHVSVLLIMSLCIHTTSSKSELKTNKCKHYFHVIHRIMCHICLWGNFHAQFVVEIMKF